MGARTVTVMTQEPTETVDVNVELPAHDTTTTEVDAALVDGGAAAPADGLTVESKEQPLQ